jgi:hypothetical protein
MGAIKKLATSLKRRLSPSLRNKVELNYLTESLQRTQDGIHIFLNFLEEKYEKEFDVYLADLRKEKIAEAKENCDNCAD